MQQTASTNLVETAGSILPTIAEGIEESERLRKLPAKTFNALVDSGLLHALRPLRYGGLEAHPRDFFEAAIEVGTVCCSTAWILAVVGIHDYAVAVMDRQAQEDVWEGDVGDVISSAYAPVGKARPTDGGFLLNGQWPFSSGSDYGDWWLLGAFVTSDDGERIDQRIFLVPKNDVTLLDDWHTFGLRGTGSRTVVVNNAFVPEHRTHRFSDVIANTNPGSEHNAGRLYGIPYLAILPYATSVGAIGAAKGAYQHLVTTARERTSRVGNVGGADDVFVLRTLGEAEQTITAIERALLENIDELYAVECTATDPHYELRARVRRDCSSAVERALQAVVSMYCVGGSSVVFTTNPLQRHLRDVAAMRAHAMNHAGGGYRLFAQQTLGVPLTDNRM